MPTTIKLKNSVTTTNAPSSLAQGEVAINVTDKKVWVGNAATTPVQLLGTGASGNFSALTCTTLTASGEITQSNTFNSASTFGFKNRIINGAMMIDQRNAGASVTPTDAQYTLDRWMFRVSQASKLTTQQNQGSVTTPTGLLSYLGITSSSSYSIASGDFFAVTQRIENFNLSDLGWGTASASPVTLSFWVRSSLTGTFGGSIYNGSGNRSYPFTYTISATNTWEQKSVTIAGDTSGTWFANNNGSGMSVNFGLGVGSTYSATAGAWNSSLTFSATGATSVVGTNGATFYITGVQLEKGSTATSFDYRPYGTELALCQRYYQIYQKPVGRGVMNGTTNLGRIGLPLQVQMRASPTMNISGTIDWFDASGVGTITALNATYTTTNAIEFDALAATGTTALGRPCVLYNGSNTGSLVASAEL
jgi:hypothetical protein